MTLASLATLDRDLPPEVPGYDLGAFLGRGASSSVWSARPTAGGAEVAIKVRTPSGLDVTGAGVRELEVAALVSSEHVVRARERIVLGDGDGDGDGDADGGVAVVLDIADGGSMHDVVALRGTLPVGEVVTIVAPLATALAHLHRAGVVHADVSPGNVLFTTSGKPMLADLSSARLSGDTETNPPVGTTGFTAPEVLAGDLPTEASDVWALGALIWFARTGGATPPGWVGWARGSGSPQSGRAGGVDAVALELEEITAAVGPQLRPVLLRLLASDPAARPSAASAALAVYRAAPAAPVLLVGRHFDPAAAVTNRLRREAAETRGRAELRRVQRARERAGRREHRLRIINRFRPVRVGLTSRTRLAMVAFGGLVLAGALLGLLKVAGSQDGGLVALAGGPGVATITADPPDASGSAHTSSTTGISGTSGTSRTTDGPGASVTKQSSDLTAALLGDPGAVLQRLADVRASALEDVDPSALLSAEPSASTSYRTDAATMERVKAARQRYDGLTFPVRSAQVLSVTAGQPAAAVLRAVVDRGAYTVLHEDGSREQLAATAGVPLDYHLQVVDGAWRLTDVSAL